jgi:lysozyme
MTGVEMAVTVLESFEGCSLRPYNCPTGHCTIGIGSTRYPNGVPVRISDPPITRDKALAMAATDLASAERSVRRLVKVPLNDYQLAALILFTQNLGEGSLAGSTLLRMVNAGDFEGAAGQFRLWDHGRVGGQLVSLPGLTIRRIAEAMIFQGIEPLVAFQVAEAKTRGRAAA